MKVNLLIGGLAMAIAAIFSSCSASQPYAWYGYDNVAYHYSTSHAEKYETLLLKTYKKMIEEPGGTRKVPPPGICADYGYLLIKQGKVKEGVKMLNLEISYYPESAKFVKLILKRYDNDDSKKGGQQ